MIDLIKDNLTKLTLDDLIKDAVERKDKEALEFLKENSAKEITRKNKQGKKITVNQPITAYRMEYLKQFCGYKNSTARQAEKTKQRKAKELADKFAAAFAAIEE